MPKTREQLDFEQRVRKARDYAKRMEQLLDKLINTRIIPSANTVVDLRDGIQRCRKHAKGIQL